MYKTIGRHVTPRITTLRQDTESLGAKAAESLIHLIEHPKTTVIQPITVGGEVYVGQTVGSIVNK